MGGAIRSLCREEAAAWRGRYRKFFKYAARALGLGFVAGFLFFVLWPAQEKRALAFVVKALKDIPLDAGPAMMALTLFYHNVRASVVWVATGVLPFLFLPILDPFLNGAVLGLLVSMARHQRMDVPRLVLTQILPHGVFELAAALYATSVGLYLCAELGQRFKRARQQRRNKKSPQPGVNTLLSPADRPGDPGIAFPSPECEPAGGPEPAPSCQTGLVRDVVRSFALVVLPLLLIAALIEAFVTPHLR